MIVKRALTWSITSRRNSNKAKYLIGNALLKRAFGLLHQLSLTRFVVILDFIKEFSAVLPDCVVISMSVAVDALKRVLLSPNGVGNVV